MSRKLRIALAGGAALVLAASALTVAAEGRWGVRTSLTGYEEVPSISTPGGGSFSATIARDKSSLRYRLTYSDLPTDVTQAHIHFGQEGVSGGVMVFLCSNLGNGPAGTQSCPVNGGTITGSIVAADIVAGAAAQGITAGEFGEVLRAIRAGFAYVNVHSVQYPPGELRGQLDRHDDDD
jgi:hypothetical protein